MHVDGEHCEDVVRENSGSEEGLHKLPEILFPLFTVRRNPLPSFQKRGSAVFFKYVKMSYLMDQGDQEGKFVERSVDGDDRKCTISGRSEISRFTSPSPGDQKGNLVGVEPIEKNGQRIHRNFFSQDVPDLQEGRIIVFDGRCRRWLKEGQLQFFLDFG